MKKGGPRSKNVVDLRGTRPNPFSTFTHNYKRGAKLILHDLGLREHPELEQHDKGQPMGAEMRRSVRRAAKRMGRGK